MRSRRVGAPGGRGAGGWVTTVSLCAPTDSVAHVRRATPYSSLTRLSKSRIIDMALPDFFLIGAPKAGTTALHSALARHPALFMSPVKEPKFYLCDGRPPPRSEHRGPGDAHSRQEWIWRRDRYEALFDAAPAGALRGESTPFYLSDVRALERIRRDVPDARLVAVLRDPVDRAFSNWLHLWSDGLETEPDVVRAVEAEDARRADGWAPFWHYRRLGLYGQHVQQLLTLFPREQLHLLRYRDLVDGPEHAVADVCTFLGVDPRDPPTPRPQNSRPSVPPDTRRTHRRARVVRAGAWAGQFLPPQAWRAAEGRCQAWLRQGDHPHPRPALTPSDRERLLPSFVDDICELETVTGGNYADWRSVEVRGSFLSRRAAPGEPGQADATS